MRRGLAVVGAVVLAVVIAVLLEARDTGPPSACADAQARFEELGNEYAAITTVPTVPFTPGGPVERNDNAAAAQDQFNAVQEMAVLSEQNPDCFTPRERSSIEATYRRWTAAGYG